MELKDLVGSYVLTGVDQLNEQYKHYSGFEDCQVIRFILNGVTYIAIEDPNDGYRSSMDEIKVSDKTTANMFPGINVVCSYREKGDNGDDDVLEIRDAKNGKLVLEVGTEDTDDYYPMFVCNWYPERLSVNEKQDLL